MTTNTMSQASSGMRARRMSGRLASRAAGLRAAWLRGNAAALTMLATAMIPASHQNTTCGPKPAGERGDEGEGDHARHAEGHVNQAEQPMRVFRAADIAMGDRKGGPGAEPGDRMQPGHGHEAGAAGWFAR